MKTSRWTMIVAAALAAAIALFFGAAGASAAPDPAASYASNPNGLQVGNTSVTQGSSVPVSGKGCTPNSTVSFALDNGTPLGSTTTDSSGNYATTVTVPSGTSVGSHTINSSGANCGSVANIAVTTASAGSGGGSGGLADTGVAVIGIGALGVVLLVGGGLMLLAGRRRRSVV